MITAVQFQELKKTKWGIQLFKISARAQAEWANEMAAKFHIADSTMVEIVNYMAEKIRRI